MRHSFDTYVSFFNSREGVAGDWFLPARDGGDAHFFVLNQAANLNLIAIVCDKNPTDTKRMIGLYCGCCLGTLLFDSSAKSANDDGGGAYHYGVLKDEIVEVLGKMAVQIGKDPNASSCFLESVVTQWCQEQAIIAQLSPEQQEQQEQQRQQGQQGQQETTTQPHRPFRDPVTLPPVASPVVRR